MTVLGKAQCLLVWSYASAIPAVSIPMTVLGKAQYY